MSTATIPGRSGQLMDLVNAALEDPDMDTDRRMRLQGEIREVLRKAHVDVHGAAGQEAHHELARKHEHAEHMLHAVLTDPELHTDLQMRLLQEIPRVTEAAYRRDSARR